MNTKSMNRLTSLQAIIEFMCGVEMIHNCFMMEKIVPIFKKILGNGDIEWRRGAHFEYITVFGDGLQKILNTL